MENGLVKSICEDTDGNELAVCLVLTYRPDHVVRAVGQAFNKGKGQNVQKVSLKASPSGHLGKENAKIHLAMKQFLPVWPHWLSPRLIPIVFGTSYGPKLVSQAHLQLMFNLPPSSFIRTTPCVDSKEMKQTPHFQQE